MSLSLPMDLSIIDELTDTQSPLYEDFSEMLIKLAPRYQLHVLLESPAGQKPALPDVDAAHVLPFSTMQGRSMLARALQCQMHVELSFVSPLEKLALFDRRMASQAELLAELGSYLDRLDQLAQVSDALAYVLLTDNTADTDVERAPLALQEFLNAWNAHAISKRQNVTLINQHSAPYGWDKAISQLLEQRRAWS